MTKAERAVELFKAGYNCSQSVVGAFAEDLGFDFDTAMKMSEAFGGGMGRMRLTCGAVSGMFMLVGMKYSKAKGGDLETRRLVYKTVQEMAEEFKHKNGSIICAELLGENLPKDNGSVPTPRTPEFYKKRPCIGCISDCAEMAEKYLKG